MNIKQAVSTALAVSLLAVPAVALAQAHSDRNSAAQGFRFSPTFEGVEPATAEGNLITSVINIVNALLTLAGIAAVVFIIVSGVRYITSQGDEDAVEQAKNGIIYGIVGIIVIILAAVIVNFFVAQVVTTTTP